MTGGQNRAEGRWLVVEGARRWARGCLADEAAVELLAGLGGRFCSTARPWVRPCVRSGWYWLDPAPLREYAGRLTPHEQRTVTLVVALLEARLARVRAVRSCPGCGGRCPDGIEEGRSMSVVGTAVVLGLLVAVLLRMRICRFSVALVCVLFGLVLGATPIGDGVNHTLTLFGSWLWSQLVTL